MTEFGELKSDGSYRHIKTIDQASIAACPHFIMVPEHYREDESCRCDDESHSEMVEWGYTWDADERRWV
jgi:hypothetical protein